MRYVTRDEMREMDRRAIDDFGIPGIVLMENAGRKTAEVVLGMLSHPERGVVSVFCGKGNNGGDGFVVARHLHNHGVNVALFATFKLAEAKDGPTDAARNLRIALHMNLPISEILAAKDIPDLGGTDVIVDALLGTGASGEVRDPLRTLIERINASGVPVVAVDIPSGLCCDRGIALGAAIRAKKTVTFACPKQGFRLADGPEHVGELIVADISIPKELVEGPQRP